MLSPEEKAARRIGGSMIAKILKKSKWGTPLDAYLELTGERPSEEKTGEDIDRGNFLEPALREWASKKTEIDFIKPMTNEVFSLAEWNWATVNPDGLSQNFGLRTANNTLLEIKAPRRDDALQWGEEGSDEVPTDALLQTHWGMMVTKADKGVVAALLGGELRIYRVARDLDLEAKMLARAREFVDQHVIPRIPPPAEWGDDKNVLFMHPRNTQPHRRFDMLTTEEQKAISAYLLDYKVSKAADEKVEQWEPVVKEIIGDTGGITGPIPGFPDFDRIDWKNNASGGTKWKDLGEDLMTNALNMSKTEQENLKKEHAGTVPRVLRPWFRKVK